MHVNTTTLNERRPWLNAALWLLALGALFFSSYNSANWLASQRLSVPSIVFEWEHAIPYWAWTIVPYWSIDLFYAASLFICATRRELNTHALRLLAVQLISITMFVIAPLRFSFERPVTDGVFGALLDALLLFDKPFNQAPALHVSLLVVLWVRYSLHLSGLWRWLLHIWFSLIGISVLTTYQHHFFDIPTGVWVGWFCVWLFPEHGVPVLRLFRIAREPQRRKLALRYALGALATGVISIYLGGWALWLLWISAALGLVAIIYFCLDATAFQKDATGRMSLASRVLLAPFLIGAWINSRWWTRHTSAASALTPHVWIGRIPAGNDDLPHGVHGMLDLCAELPCKVEPRMYIHEPALDLVPLSTTQLARAAESIARAVAHGPVLVCCALGYSRSAAAAAAWLITQRHAADAPAAVARVREARPHVVLSEPQLAALQELAQSGSVK